MQKIILWTVWVLTVAVLSIAPENKHQCNYPKCPYKGVRMDKASIRSAVMQYTETDDGDAFYLDVLHIEYPAANYEQLEDLLFNL